MAEPKLKLLNFVSATQTDAENESASDTKPLEIIDNRPLYEILKENSDKKEAEFNERFKHSLLSCLQKIVCLCSCIFYSLHLIDLL